MLGLGIIQRGLSMIRDLIGRPFREWAERADKDPGAAGRQVEAIAVVLKGRADAIAERRGDGAWRVRRDRHIAKSLFKYADKLREEAEQRATGGRSSICDGFEQVCKDAIERAKKGG